MINYANGKIYFIYDWTNDEQYIGSTTISLKRRLLKHEGHYREWLNKTNSYVSSFKIIANGNYDIYLIENYPCETLEQLRIRERHWQDKWPCINMVKAYVSPEEKKLHQLQYVQENKEHIKEYHHQYYLDNKEDFAIWGKQYREEHKTEYQEYHKEYYKQNSDKIKAKVKEYADNNKDLIKERSKKYRESHHEEKIQKDREYRARNKEKLNESRRQRVVCECGCEYSSGSKAYHMRSQKHLDFINQK